MIWVQKKGNTMNTTVAEKPAKDVVAKAPKAPERFGPTYPGHYPSEMRTQMWPLCCGARIISGFKNVATLNDAQLDQAIKDTLAAIPDHQIFSGETFKPAFTFLTLNSGQTASPKLMAAVERAGFKLIFTGSPRGSKQSFFLLDTSGTYKAA